MTLAERIIPKELPEVATTVYLDKESAITLGLTIFLSVAAILIVNKILQNV